MRAIGALSGALRSLKPPKTEKNKILIGWHTVGIVEYPDSKTLVRISASPEFREIESHRLAGLEGQLNITCREHPLGE